MTGYILYLLVPFVLVLVFLLARLFIVKYFEAKKRRYSSDSNYPLVLGILILFTGLIAITQGISPLLELFAGLIKKIFGVELKVPGSLNIYSLVMYALFCAAMVLIFFFYYKRYRIERELAEREEMKKAQEISFPGDPEPESPIFHERIKELFNLKYKKNDLQLEYDGKDKILYGRYKDGLHDYVLVIYCDDSVSNKKVTKSRQNEVFNHISQNIVPRLVEADRENIIDIYYLLENGKFEENDNKEMITLTEDDFLNALIDFERYLEELVYKYKNDKLFSAIAKEEDKFTLEQTFINPSFNDRQEDLDKYIDEWLLESSLKHLVILGDYGMGKSSFLKFYAARLAEEILEGKKVKRFPVFISLTNTSPMHGGIEKSVGHFVSQKLGVAGELFQKLVHRGKILFILDGFDEMGFIGTHEQRFEQFNAIWQLATKNNKILIAGRPSYFPTEFEMKSTLNIAGKEKEATQVKPYCESLTLDRFDEKRIEESMKKYYPEKNQSQKYITFIKNNASIYDLCRRPSMMHIIREMVPEIHQKFKTDILTPGKLMQQYVEYWIDRQESKAIKSAFRGNDQQKKTFIIDFFQELAEDLYKRDELKISAKEISEKIKSRLHTLKFDKGNTELIEGFESEILTGYFIEKEENEYKFVHKPFFEYFVAMKIVESIRSRNLKDPIMKRDWSIEIIDFIYDFIDKEKCADQNIPSLLCVLNPRWLAKIKANFFKILINLILPFWEKLFSFFVAFGVLICSTAIIRSIEPFGSLYHLVVFVLYFAILCYVWILVSMGFVILEGPRSFFNFILKSYKIGFVKNEIDLKKNITVLILLLRRSGPMTLDTINNIEIKNRYFMLGSYLKNSSIVTVDFIKCELGNMKFEVCSLQDVNFNGSIIGFSGFNDCRFINVNFEDCKLRLSSRLMGNLFSWSVKKIKREWKSRGDVWVEFKNIKKSNMDESTLRSLKELIDKGNYVVSKHIVGDEWLMEELEKETDNVLTNR